MQGLFSWEKSGADDWAPYLGNAKIDPLAPLKVGMNFDQKQETGFAPAPAPAAGGGVPGSPAGVSAEGGMNPLVKKLLGKGKDEIKKYLDEWKKGKDSPFGGDGFEYNKDEWSFKDGKLEYHPLDDAMSPRNWTWDTATGKFINNNPGAWNPDNYGGSLYDPNNPFGLDDDAWAGLSGLINSGSLAEEGLGLLKNASLAGGLSDMGGVADEIAGLGGGGGFMDGAIGAAGKILPFVGLGLSAYNMAKSGEVTPMGAMGLGTAAVAASAAAASAAGVAGASMGPWGLLPAATLMAGQALANKPSREYFDPYYGTDLGDGRYLMMGGKVEGDDDVSYDDVGSDGLRNNLSDSRSQWALIYDSNTDTYSRVDMGSLYDRQTRGSLDPEKYAKEIFDNEQAVADEFGGPTRTYEEILEEVKSSQATDPNSYEPDYGMGGEAPTPEWQRNATMIDLMRRGLLSEDTIKEHALKAIEDGRMTPLEYGKFKDQIAVTNYSKKYPMMLWSLRAAFDRMYEQYGWGKTDNGTE